MAKRHPKRYYDSSVTRIVPLFNFINATKTKERFAAFISCLQNTTTYKSCATQETLKSLSDYNQLISPIYYGKQGVKSDGKTIEPGEKTGLHPQSELLRWLIKEGGIDPRIRIPTSEDVQERITLFSDIKNGEKRLQAITELNNWLQSTHRKANPWFRFEAPTKPDAYIETDTYILIIEGKRFENKLTTHTTWMDYDRDQLIRHMDSICDLTTGTFRNGEIQKPVYGLYIVPSKNDPIIKRHEIAFYDYVSACKRYSDINYWRRSLPHRADKDKYEGSIEVMQKCFLGTLTWEAIEASISGLRFPQNKDELRHA